MNGKINASEAPFVSNCDIKREFFPNLPRILVPGILLFLDSGLVINFLHFRLDETIFIESSSQLYRDADNSLGSLSHFLIIASGGL